MRTRNSDTAKSTVTPKKAPPVKKTAAKSETTTPTSSVSPAKRTAAKTQTTPPSREQLCAESPAPKSSEKKSGSSTTAKHATSTTESVSISVPSTALQPEITPQVEEAKAQDDAVEGIAESKPSTRRKIIKRVVRRVVRKAPASAIIATGQPPNSEESEQARIALLGQVQSEVSIQNVTVPEKKEESSIRNIEGFAVENLKTSNAEDSTTKAEESSKNEICTSENAVQSLDEQEPTLADVKPVDDAEPTLKGLEEEEKLKTTIEDTAEPKSDIGVMEEDPKEEMTDFDGLLEEADEESVHDELCQEDFPEGDLQGQGEEAAVLEDECAELNAAAKERKLRKELEIFVGGLDRDVVEEDIKRVFQHAGEVVGVRLYRDPATNKNKGYAFVRFATKEQASRALSEMRNPVIRGKRCGIAASEDNDTLFLGNICNTWTKEAIKQKLKEYGIGAVEKITLVADPKDEGLSRGFAFLEFSSHSEAMLAYKRLQKPDVVFGHSERTAKVAFAEPLREPDPEVMSQVKSVFVDGLPPHWDEDRVMEKFKQFGEIARVMLARNMSTAKRKDFGFVDFTTHEAAVACVESLDNTELGDGNLKTRVRVRLANPLPKTQAVKGGMAGGFRISHGGGGTFSRHGGRGFGRGGHAFNRANFQRGRDFYPRGPGQGSRMGFAEAHELDGQCPPFYGMQSFGPGGRRGFRGAHQVRGGPQLPARSIFDRSGHGGYVGYDQSRRRPFPSEDAFSQPFPERQYGDRYYEDTACGMKRPYFMEDPNPDYVEPNIGRPRFEYPEPSISHRGRFEYPEPSISHHGTHYRDAFGADGGFLRQDYYPSDYDGGMHPSFYGDDRPYRRGYYY